MQPVAGHGQTVQGYPGSGQGCEPGCLREANVILLGVLSVRLILLHSPPPPLLVLLTDNSLTCPFIFPFLFINIFKLLLATHCSFSIFKHSSQEILFLFCFSFMTVPMGHHTQIVFMIHLGKANF